MRNLHSTLLLTLIVAGYTTNLTNAGIIYNDATGDLHSTFSSHPHLDIKSVEISNTATDISFKIEVNTASITSPNWGKYMIAINSVAGGTNTGNGWGRPINMNGMDYWFGGWVDASQQHQLWQFTGGSWSNLGAVANTISGSTVTFTRPLSSLGLSIGSTFTFDVFSSGGGSNDGAVDALSMSTPSITNWNNSFTSTSGLTYTVVPEPTAMLLVGLVSAVGLARRRKN